MVEGNDKANLDPVSTGDVLHFGDRCQYRSDQVRGAH